MHDTQTPCYQVTSGEWRMRESNPRPPACKADFGPAPRSFFSTICRSSLLGRISAYAAVGAAMCVLSASASAAPGYKKNPTWQDFKSEATPYEYSTLKRIALCEMGSGPKVKGSPWRVRWSRGRTLPRYSSAFGIWNGNFAETKRITGLPWPTANPAAEATHALALARRYGFSAWACF